MSLNSSGAEMRSGRMWLGTIVSSGIPHFDGKAVDYVLADGATEARIYVVGMCRDSILYYTLYGPNLETYSVQKVILLETCYHFFLVRFRVLTLNHSEVHVIPLSPLPSSQVFIAFI